jgi:putative hydrolase of the HAD superfamily
MIRAVIFDLDGTLFDRATSVARLARRQHARVPALRHVPVAHYVAHFLELDARGYVPKDAVYRTLAAEIGAPASLADALFDDFRAHYHDACVPMLGMASLLTLLRERGMRLGIITNGGDAFQRRTVAALGIADQIDVVLISEAEGVKKPDPEIFHRACAQLGVAPRETVFVGDHPAVDVDGAAAAGLWAVWLRDPFWEPPCRADAVIAQLLDLPDVLSRLT